MPGDDDDVDQGVASPSFVGSIPPPPPGNASPFRARRQQVGYITFCSLRASSRERESVESFLSRVGVGSSTHSTIEKSHTQRELENKEMSPTNNTTQWQ
jgi:hypothetical protein